VRALLAAAAASLLLAAPAGASTFSVLPGMAALPSAEVANAPGDIVLPADLMTPPAQPAPISYDELLSLWRHAGEAYGVPWEVLAAINEIESGFGADMGPSSANAIGWMQFLPSTWEDWGVDGNGDGVADPWNPTDAVYAAARYLAATGAHEDLGRAVFSYNHAQWYVDRVLGLAADYLANPLRGRSLLYAPPGSTLPAGQSLEDELREARARLDSVGRQIAAIDERLAGSDSELARAELRVGDPSLSDHAFREARARVDALVEGTQALHVRRDELTADLAEVRNQIVILEQGLAEQQTASLAGGLQGLIGQPPTPEAARVIDYAVKQLGIPYQWGGNHGFSLEQMESQDPVVANGFDCSSLLAWSFAKGAGIYIGDYTGTQWAYGATAPGAIRGAGPAQGGSAPPGGYMPGDLIFFDDTEHVALYLGNDLFIHAPHTGDVVRVARLSDYPLQVWGWVRYEAVSGLRSGEPAPFSEATKRVFTVVAAAPAEDPEPVVDGSVLTFTRG
jgi:cell wall-associated NlpC family hydrolase